MNRASPTSRAPFGAPRARRRPTSSAAFLMCAERRCYVAATMETEDGLLGVLGIRGVDSPGYDGRSPKLMTFDDEPAATRAAGRKGRWAPAVLVEAQPNA